MNIEERIIDYLSGELSEQEAKEVRQIIETDPEAQSLYDEYKEVTETIRETPLMTPDESWVKTMSESFINRKEADSKVITIPARGIYTKIAAVAACLLIGFLCYNTYQQNQTLTEVENELFVMRQVLHNDLNQSSVSTRIKAVLYSENINTEDEELPSILAQTMINDPSAHVRLAATEALRNWTDLSYIKSTMIEALKNENDPSIKILLIEILSSTKDSGVGPHLDDLINDDNQPLYIKEEAHKGIFRVSNKKTFL